MITNITQYYHSNDLLVSDNIICIMHAHSIITIHMHSSAECVDYHNITHLSVVLTTGNVCGNTVCECVCMYVYMYVCIGYYTPAAGV